MYQINVIDFIFIGIPECLLVVWAIFSINKKKIIWKNYIFAGILYSIIGLITRVLPLPFGLHIILNIIALITISILIVKIPVVRAISCGLLTIALRAICDVIYYIVLVDIIKIDIQTKFRDTLIKDIYGIPSLLLFVFIILILKVLKGKRKQQVTSA